MVGSDLIEILKKMERVVAERFVKTAFSQEKKEKYFIEERPHSSVNERSFLSRFLGNIFGK